MFTGIVEEIGEVAYINRLNVGAKLKIFCSDILQDIKVGDSISVNGCCQTVTEFDSKSFTSDVSEETYKVTNFSDMEAGNKVNLERALLPTTRMGGHIVQGHIDCVAVFYGLEKLSDFFNLKFQISEQYIKYIVKKGSISVNGISLTISDINNNIFTVATIPHTYYKTTLSTLNIGNKVNIETDIIGRYIEKFLLSDNNGKSKISESFLRENGFV